MFTQNRVCAAPVQVCRERLPAAERARRRHLLRQRQRLHRRAGPGRRPPHDRARRRGASAAGPSRCSSAPPASSAGRCRWPCIEPGIPQAASELDAGADALERRRPRHPHDRHAHQGSHPARCTCDGQRGPHHRLRQGGGDDRPEHGDDARVRPHRRRRRRRPTSPACAPAAAEQSFNCISVEGHTSTNDTLLFLANGAGPKLTGRRPGAVPRRRPRRSAPTWPGPSPPTPRGRRTWSRSRSKGLRDRRRGPPRRQDGRRQRPGQDGDLRRRPELGPHRLRGRLCRRARSRKSDLSLWLGDIAAVRGGHAAAVRRGGGVGLPEEQPRLDAASALHPRPGRCTFWTCDLTYEYVRLNADYTT